MLLCDQPKLASARRIFTRINRSTALLGTLLLITACTNQTTKIDNQTPSTAKVDFIEDASTTERLLAVPPFEWQLVYQLNSASVKLSDFVPPEQTADEFESKLSFEAHGEVLETDPIKILESKQNQLFDVCTDVKGTNLFSGYENNYPTSVRILECGRNAHSSKGEISVVKAIRGDDYLYMVTFVKRIAPFKKGQSLMDKSEVANWAEYLKRVTLCNPQDDSHPCPAN